MPQFTLEIAYSQVAAFNPSLEQPFNHWTQAHFDQGFVWRPESVSFRTAARTGFGIIVVDRVESPQLRPDAMAAIRVPFILTQPRLEIASVFKGETLPFEAGEYTLYFQTGREGIAPWITFEFVRGKIDEPEILQNAAHLRPAAELLMTAEPA
jgi:hypothetical protein